MNDEREILERELRRFEPEPGLAQRVYRRRDRKRRNQRIGAGVIGVIVALATGILLARALTFNGVPATPPKPLGAGEALTVMNGDLVAEDPDTGEMRTIVKESVLPPREGTPKEITSAAWSPDHRWVAYRAGALWLSDASGGAPRQLTPDQGWYPWAWSPTEDQLAVVQRRDVTLIDAATGRETDLGNMTLADDGDGYPVHTLVWSPDGTRIAYDGGPGDGSVYSIDVESGKHSLLVRQPAGAGRIQGMDWSPDGAHLAISYEEASPDGPDSLYLANSDGSDVRLLDYFVAGQWGVFTPGMSVATAWSPDGNRLAYMNFAGPDHQDLQVWTVSLDGSAPSLIASACCQAFEPKPAWSPDGSEIAFEAEPAGPQPLPHHHPTLVVGADGTGDPMQIDELTYLSWAGGWYFCYCYG